MYRPAAEPPYEQPGRYDLYENQRRQNRGVLDDRRERAGPRKHQRDVDQVEDDDSDEQPLEPPI